MPVALRRIAVLVALLAACSTPARTPAEDRSGSLLESARAEHARGDFEAARAHAEEAIALLAPRVESAEPKPEPSDIDRLGQLGEIAHDTGALVAARRAREQVVHGCERLFTPDASNTLAARQNLARTLRELGDLQGALEIEEAVLAAYLTRLPPDDPALIAAKLNLSNTRADLGDLEGARELAEDVHDAMTRIRPPDDLELLAARMNVATLRAELGDPENALALLESVHESWTRLLPEDHPHRIAASMNLAVLRAAQGDLEGALALEESVVASYARLLPAEHPDRLRAEINLATSRKHLGDLQGAREIEEAVLVAAERSLPPDHPDRIVAQQNLAVTREALGDARGAHELFESVHEARTRLLPPGHPDLLLAKRNLGITLAALGDVRGADAMFQVVLAGSEALFGDDHPDLLAAKSNLAGTRRELGDVRAAAELFAEVFAARERRLPREHPDRLDSAMNLGIALGQLGELDRARELQEGVLAARESVLSPDHPELLEARTTLALTRARMGDGDGCRTLVLDALAGLRARCATLEAESPRAAREGVADGIDALGRLLSIDSDPVLAAEFLATLESLRHVPVANARLGHALRSRPDLAEYARGIALARQRIHDLAATGFERDQDAESWRRELLALGEQRDRAERQLRAQVPAGGAVVETAAVARQLDPASAAVSILRFERWKDLAPDREPVESLLAFVLRPDASVVHVDLGAAQEVESLVLAWRDAIGTSPDSLPPEPLAPSSFALALRGLAGPPAERGDAIPTGRALRARVIDPLLGAVGPDVRVLHVVPDDALLLVQLDALPLEDGNPLGDRVEVRVQTGFSELARPFAAEWESNSAALLLVGDVDFDGGTTPGQAAVDRSSLPARFAPLPATRAECQDIARHYRRVFGREAVRLEGESATKERLESLAPSIAFLHVATHGWFSSDPGGLDGRARRSLTGVAPDTLCGLALSGANRGRDEAGRLPGLLTAEELSTFDLSACRLAVLSACESNVGVRRPGQALRSLQTALHAAGASTSVTSLWKVDDAATSRLFEHFYGLLWEDGLGPAAALWGAKRRLREEGRPARDWAGWVLSGAPAGD